LGLKFFPRGFCLLVERRVSNDVSQHIGQGNDSKQTPLPAPTLFIFFSLDDDQSVHTTFVDQLEKCSERIRSGANDNAREVWRALVERLSDR
jgi:hypothetical protein